MVKDFQASFQKQTNKQMALSGFSISIPMPSLLKKNETTGKVMNQGCHILRKQSLQADGQEVGGCSQQSERKREPEDTT